MNNFSAIAKISAGVDCKVYLAALEIIENNKDKTRTSDKTIQYLTLKTCDLKSFNEITEDVAKIRHENIECIYRIFKDFDREKVFIIEENYPYTLEEFHKHYSLKKLPEIAWGVLRALKILHCDLKIAHCDIKLNNIMIDRQHKARLIDFNNSIPEKFLGKKELDVYGETTPIKMVGMGGLNWSFDVDCWALAMCLYTLIFNFKSLMYEASVVANVKHMYKQDLFFVSKHQTLIMRKFVYNEIEKMYKSSDKNENITALISDCNFVNENFLNFFKGRFIDEPEKSKND